MSGCLKRYNILFDACCGWVVVGWIKCYRQCYQQSVRHLHMYLCCEAMPMEGGEREKGRKGGNNKRMNK